MGGNSDCCHVIVIVKGVNMSNGKYYGEINENVLMSLADDMAAAATTFNSHGYEVFINSRESFKSALHELCKGSKDSNPTD